MKEHFSLAYSTCPNDTYIFHALVHGLIPLDSTISPSPRFNVTLADVETLNQEAQKETYDITKLSFAAFGSLRETYGLLRTGAALGRGCGPLVVSLPGRSLDSDLNNGHIKRYDTTKTEHPRTCRSGNSHIEMPIVAVPGMGTTAFVLFNLFMKDRFPEVRPRFRPMPFEKIMPSVKEQAVDFGVIIHEGRFIYQQMGLASLVDLGAWWEDKTGLPIPLGCIAVKRRLGNAFAKTIERLIGSSLNYAMAHPDAGKEYIKHHAQEMDDQVIQDHIRLYVNSFSNTLGEEGEAAIRVFYEKARKANLIPFSDAPLFAC